MWFNVKGNYMLFVGKILLNLYSNNTALILLNLKQCNSTHFLADFDASQILGRTSINTSRGV